MANTTTHSVLILLLLTGAARSKEDPKHDQTHVFVATVDHVVNGDSVVVNYRGDKISIRIEGVDAPELWQAFGKQSRAALARALPEGAEVIIEDKGRGKYGRMLGIVHNRKFSPDSISLSLVKDGYVWHFKKYNNNETLAAAEKLAQSKKRGLWNRESLPTPPWEYRDQKDRGEVMEPRTVHKPSAQYERHRQQVRLTHWLNFDGNKRHQAGCRNANHGHGRPCTAGEGEACNVCGGDREAKRSNF